MTLAELNKLDTPGLKDELAKCCGSARWIEGMIAARPFIDKDDLFEKSDSAWEDCNEEDFLEAFSHHPKIGDVESIKKRYASTAHWAEGEQSGIKGSEPEVLAALAECNKLYEEKFGYIFIINASEKSAEEILGSLRWRLLNTKEDEIQIAAKEQNEITKIRLEKLLA